MSRNKLGLGRHTSIPEGLKKSLENLIFQSQVKRTILGRFYNCHPKFQKGYLKYQMNTPTGIKVNGYIKSGVQEIFVVIDSLEKRQEVIDYIKKTYG
jgi:hypothetical protein